MKTMHMILVMLAILAPTWVFAEDSPWDSSIEYFKEYQLLPSRVIIRTEVSGISGELFESSQLHSRLVRKIDGTILLKVTEGLIDGRMIQQDELKEMEEILEEDDLLSSLLFFTALNEDFSYSGTDTCREHQGRLGCLYAFHGRMDDKAAAGEIWLDSETGLPLSVTWRIIDVPFTQEQLTIHSLQQEERYHMSEDGVWVLGSSITRISADYAVLFMKEKITVQTTQEYYDHIHRSGLPGKGDVAKL